MLYGRNVVIVYCFDNLISSNAQNYVPSHDCRGHMSTHGAAGYCPRPCVIRASTYGTMPCPRLVRARPRDFAKAKSQTGQYRLYGRLHSGRSGSRMAPNSLAQILLLNRVGLTPPPATRGTWV